MYRFDYSTTDVRGCGTDAAVTASHKTSRGILPAWREPGDLIGYMFAPDLDQITLFLKRGKNRELQLQLYDRVKLNWDDHVKVSSVFTLFHRSL